MAGWCTAKSCTSSNSRRPTISALPSTTWFSCCHRLFSTATASEAVGLDPGDDDLVTDVLVDFAAAQLDRFGDCRKHGGEEPMCLQRPEPLGFPATSGAAWLKPVMLPPGWDRLSARPILSG